MARGWTTIDTWHRPERGKGPLRELCLRCDVPVRRHPSWWRRQQRGLNPVWSDYVAWLVLLAVVASVNRQRPLANRVLAIRMP